MRRDAQAKPEFYVHLSVTVSCTVSRPLAHHVIGIHEHQHGYSYAVLGLDGSVARDVQGAELVGDVTIPAHVDPAKGAKANTNNYVFEVANAIVRIAGDAFIGIEDTSWMKGASSLSRSQNRDTFRRPSQRIAGIIGDKALRAGLPRPLSIRGIAPTRDCAACNTRHAPGTYTLITRQVIACPRCETTRLVTDEHRCEGCGQPCEDSEVRNKLLFLCPTCHAPPRPVHYNTAVVVARELLRILAR